MNTVDRVKAICKERKIAISKLEKELGLPNASIAGLKRGEISSDRVVKIAKYFNVSTDYLLTGKEKTYSESMAVLANIRHDKAMMDALEKYLTLPDEKKKHIIETINMLFEG